MISKITHNINNLRSKQTLQGPWVTELQRIHMLLNSNQLIQNATGGEQITALTVFFYLFFPRVSVFTLRTITSKWEKQQKRRRRRLCSPVQSQITPFCQCCDLRLGVVSYHSLFRMHRGNALTETTLKEEEGVDIRLRYEIYLSRGVNPVGGICNIWLLQTAASWFIRNEERAKRQTEQPGTPLFQL